jgi:hypothetical protein
MLGDASDFTPLDLLGALALNAVSTNVACKNDAFRVGIKNKTTGDIPAWADFRFLGGVAAAAAAQFGGPMVRRAGHDAAVGLLGSYVATETCRKHAIARLNAVQGGGAAAAPQQIPAQAAPQPVPAAAPAGAPNYAYGW